MFVGGLVTDSCFNGFHIISDFFSYFLVCDAGFLYICFLVYMCVFLYCYILIFRYLYIGVCVLYMVIRFQCVVDTIDAMLRCSYPFEVRSSGTDVRVS